MVGFDGETSTGTVADHGGGARYERVLGEVGSEGPRFGQDQYGVVQEQLVFVGGFSAVHPSMFQADTIIDGNPQGAR